MPFRVLHETCDDFEFSDQCLASEYSLIALNGDSDCEKAA
jgi:hypothetical protein